ncbi:MAG: sulfatase [Bacteroidota bacterium]
MLQLFASCAPSSKDAFPARGSGAERPNVLFILVDDLRPALGAYGDQRAITPHLDAFAETAVLFERAYIHQAICAPSRAHLMTGLRPEALGWYDIGPRVSETHPDHTTLPQRFREAGYTTVAVRGKVYHHGDDDPEGWTRRVETEREGGLRGFMSEEGRALEARPGSQRGGRGPAWERADAPDSLYRTTRVAEAAIDELAGLAEADAPFFLAVGFRKPHLAFIAPEWAWATHDTTDWSPPPNAAPPDGMPEIAATTFGELRRYAKTPAEGPVPDSTARRLRQGYYAATTFVDHEFGRILDALDAEGLADNTIVVVWGDHGYKLGEYGLWVKHTHFEVDNRIPLLVRAPGHGIAGARVPGLVETVDVYPTLADLAGLDGPDAFPDTPVQGTSFVPLLADPERPWKRAAFWHYPRFLGDTTRTTIGRSVRTERVRYTEWTHLASGEVVARELYDHDVDPLETRNVADDPAYAALAREAAAALAAGPDAALPPLLTSDAPAP